MINVLYSVDRGSELEYNNNIIVLILNEILMFTLRLSSSSERKVMSSFKNCFKPWPKGPASGRRWTQIELAQRLVLGGQTDSKVSSQVYACGKKKKHFKADYPLLHWVILGYWTSLNLC